MKSGDYIFNEDRCDFCGELNSERIKSTNFLNSRRFPAACCGELQYLAQFMKRAVDCCKYNVSSIHYFDVFYFPVWRTNEQLWFLKLRG